MLLYIYILCMYLILSILIAMGESIQCPKPESEIRFGWGLSYNYIGQMHHNLNKYVSYYRPNPQTTKQTIPYPDN